MKPLRIVLVMIEAPIPFGSAASRWFYVLYRELVARGHHVTAYAVCSKQSEMAAARSLFPAPKFDLRLYPVRTQSGLRSRLNTLRRPQSYMFSVEMKTDLGNELKRGFDVLHLEHIWSGWVGLNDTSKAVLSVLSLYQIDLANVARPPGVFNRLRHWLLLWGEARLIRAYPVVTTLSDRLKHGIQNVNPRADVTVIPLGIDPDLYEYIPDTSRSEHAVVSLIGSMNWYPSQSAAVRLLTRLWPAIHAQMPDARLQVIGWGARTALRDYLDTPGVQIEENVPETRSYFERSSVLLYAPERGSGMKVKVLEALAYGVPVVTTTEGVEGLDAVDGLHAGISDDDQGLIDKTVALLKDMAAQHRQRAAGRALLETQCGPGPTVDQVERLYERLQFGVRDV